MTIPKGPLSKSAIRDIVSGALRQGCIGIKILGGYDPFSPETTSDIIAGVERAAGLMSPFTWARRKRAAISKV